MTNTRLFDTVTVPTRNLGYEVGKVYKTDDLTIFKFSKFNRNVLLKQEMINQAKQGLISPIIINEDFIVIDGQHRLRAAQEAKVPVEYIVKPGLGEHDIVRMNTIQRKWSMTDYIEAFANRGLSEYIKLLDLIGKKTANVTDVVQISTDVISASVTHELIEKGVFKFFNYDKAVEFLEYYLRFRKETQTPKRSTVTMALWTLFKLKNVDRDRIIRKVIASGLSEEIKIKNYNQSEILKEIIDSYNNKLGVNNARYINYSIASTGAIVIDVELQDWADKSSKEK